MVKQGKSKSKTTSRKSRSRARSSSRSGRSRTTKKAAATPSRSRSHAKDRHRSPSSDGSSSSRGHVEAKTKRPLNAYNAYIKDKMQNRKFLKGEVVQEMKNLAAKWKVMSDDEKKKYKGMADEANRKEGVGGD